VDIEPNKGDPIGIDHHISVSDNRIVNCVIGVTCYNTTVGTHHLLISSNLISGCKTGIATEANESAIIGNLVDGATSCGIGANNCDSCTIVANVVDCAGNLGIYTDTNGVKSPSGHVVLNNRVRGTLADNGRNTVSQNNVKK